MRVELIRFGVMTAPVRHMVLHCAAIPTGFFEGRSGPHIRDVIKRWHIARGFSDVGYHYIVTPQGFVTIGRPVSKQGAHTLGLNATTLGVLLIESAKVTKVGDFADYYTDRQRLAVRELARHHGITRVSGHNDHSPRLCPGFRVKTEDFV